MPFVSRKKAQVIAGGIAKTLGETQTKPRRQIMRIVMLCGEEMAQALLTQTLATEKAGGIMTNDGKRRRTPGGVFFHLARNQMSDDVRRQIFYPWQMVAQKQLTYESQFPAFEWAERQTVLERILAEKGEVATVKITLTGRPGAIERRQNLVITTMEQQFSETMNFPVGVPAPSLDPMTYTVYVAAKQWERVVKAIENPDDLLVVEGLCAFDAETKMMAVYTLYVSTEKMQKKEKKAAKKNDPVATPSKTKAPAKENKKPSAPKAAKVKVEKALPVVPPKTDPVEVVIPAGAPEDVAEKLAGLHKAAATFRQKMADIMAKPDDQRYGLEMAHKLLISTEKQIEDLEKPYLDPS